MCILLSQCKLGLFEIASSPNDCGLRELSKQPLPIPTRSSYQPLAELQAPLHPEDLSATWMGNQEDLSEYAQCSISKVKL